FGAGAGLLRVAELGDEGLPAGAAAAHLVEVEVAGDGGEPGHRVGAAPGEAADAAQGAREHLLGEVLGQVPVPGAAQQVAVHECVVLAVEVGERLPAPGAGTSGPRGLRGGPPGGL